MHTLNKDIAKKKTNQIYNIMPIDYFFNKFYRIQVIKLIIYCVVIYLFIKCGNVSMMVGRSASKQYRS